MNPQNSGPYCILGRDLKLLSRQSFNSLLQFSIAACSILLRHAFVSSAFYSIATKFPLSRHIFLWLFNTLSCKVCRSVHSMSRHSHVWLLEHLCCDTDNCVATLFLFNFFNLCRDPVFYVTTAFLLVLCCNNVFCIISIHVATRKFYCNRFLSSLTLFSCCNFIFMLRHSLLV